MAGPATPHEVDPPGFMSAEMNLAANNKLKLYVCMKCGATLFDDKKIVSIHASYHRINDVHIIPEMP